MLSCSCIWCADDVIENQPSSGSHFRFHIGDLVTNAYPHTGSWLHGVVVALSNGDNEEYIVRIDDVTHVIHLCDRDIVPGHCRRSMRQGDRRRKSASVQLASQ